MKYQIIQMVLPLFLIVIFFIEILHCFSYLQALKLGSCDRNEKKEKKPVKWHILGMMIRLWIFII